MTKQTISVKSLTKFLENKKNNCIIIFAFVSLALVGILLMIPAVQNIGIKIGEMIAGRELRDYNKWHGVINEISRFVLMCSVVSLFFFFAPNVKFDIAKYKIEYVFIISIIITFILHFMLLILGHERQLNVYFLRLNDFFADFLNPVRYSAQRDPFFDETIHPMHHNNSALSFIFPYFASKIAALEAPVKGVSLQALWQNKTLILITFFYLFFSSMLTIHSLCCLAKKFNVNKLIILPLFLSAPFLFTIERANHILITAAFVFYFLAFYDSEEKILVWFACICLGLAAALKIFPAAFGMLFFHKKQYKEIFLSALFAMLFFFLPFLFFKHGMNNFQRLIYNVSLFTSIESKTLIKTIMRISCIVFLLTSTLQSKLFYKYVAIIFSVIFISTNAGSYTSLYLFALTVFIFNTKNEADFFIPAIPKFILLIYFVLLYMPLQIINNQRGYMFGTVIRYVFFTIFIYFICDMLKSMLQKTP